ncbi:MAG: hypothetical protein V4478_01410 [Patescibacteria group bacterium]
MKTPVKFAIFVVITLMSVAFLSRNTPQELPETGIVKEVSVTVLRTIDASAGESVHVEPTTFINSTPAEIERDLKNLAMFRPGTADLEYATANLTIQQPGRKATVIECPYTGQVKGDEVFIPSGEVLKTKIASR